MSEIQFNSTNDSDRVTTKVSLVSVLSRLFTRGLEVHKVSELLRAQELKASHHHHALISDAVALNCSSPLSFSFHLHLQLLDLVEKKRGKRKARKWKEEGKAAAFFSQDKQHDRCRAPLHCSPSPTLLWVHSWSSWCFS